MELLCEYTEEAEEKDDVPADGDSSNIWNKAGNGMSLRTDKSSGSETISDPGLDGGVMC